MLDFISVEIWGPPEKNFMSGKIFIDTNILIYAHDFDTGAKREKATLIVRQAWETGLGMVSTQCCKSSTSMSPARSPARARGILNNYLAWQVEINGPRTILYASEIEERHQLSFWDSMIIAAATQGRAEQILTEDLNHGQVIEGIRIENPFHVE